MQKLALSLLALAPIAVFAAACGPGNTTVDSSGGAAAGGAGGGVGGGNSADACVISTDIRTMIQETLTEIALTGISVAEATTDKQVGFGIQIPGSDKSFVGYRTIVTTCPNSSAVSFCDSTTPGGGSDDPFWKVHDRCGRVRCEQGGSNVALVDTFLTMQPKTLATDKHEFTYDTTEPTGTATFDPNPFLTWRIDMTDMAAIQIDAKITNVVRILQTDDTFVDFSHTGNISVSRTDASVSLVTLDLEWISLLSGGAKLTGSLQVDAAGGVNGDVVAGEEPIAAIKDEYKFTWLGDCAPAK